MKNKTTAKKKTVTKAKRSRVLSPFYINLQLADENLKAKGKTIESCLDKINPVVLKSKGIMNIKSTVDKKQVQFMMRPFQIKRLLVSDFNKGVFAKRMLTLMK